MNKQSIIRRNRKELMRLGTITREELLNKDDDGAKLPKKHWGYSVDVTVKGHSVCAIDNNRYEAMKSALDCAQWINDSFEPYDECCKTIETK